MKQFSTIILLLLTSLVMVFSCFAEENTIETTGSSVVSFEEAIRQAQRSAVEEAVGTLIHAVSEVENYTLKKDKIIARTQGYITKYSVLSKSETGGTYTVHIRANVSLESIKNDLIAMKILMESMEHPKIMILVEENYKNMDDLGMQIASIELSSLLGSKGFELVDKAQLEAAKSMDQQQLALDGNTAAAASLGLRFGAQYVIVGKAVAQDAGEAFPGSGIKSVQASLQLQVIQTQTATILGSIVKNGVAAHMSPLTGATQALQDIAKKAVDEYLVESITDSFQDFLNNGAPLKLHIDGVDSFRQYKDVSGEVEGLGRVVSSKKEGWNRTSGILSLSLRFKGTSEELADMLDGHEVGSKKLMVVDFAPERVNCTYK